MQQKRDRQLDTFALWWLLEYYVSKYVEWTLILTGFNMIVLCVLKSYVLAIQCCF